MQPSVLSIITCSIILLIVERILSRDSCAQSENTFQCIRLMKSIIDTSNDPLLSINAFRSFNRSISFRNVSRSVDRIFNLLANSDTFTPASITATRFVILTFNSPTLVFFASINAEICDVSCLSLRFASIYPISKAIMTQ